MGNFQKLKLIRKSLTLGACKIIALGLVISHLDYANALYANLPDTEIKKLQRIQSMTAKVITGARKYDSTTAALKTLHWLPIHLRIKYKILTLVFKTIHGQAPEYLKDLLKPSCDRPTRKGLRSELNKHSLTVPFTKCMTFADRSFSVYGPRLWNDLPDNLKSLEDFTIFKSKLKTHLFQMF